MKCPRCSWQHDPHGDESAREQLREHAQAVEHPTCGVCHRVLAHTDTRTCEACIAHARQLLADISAWYAELEDEIGQPHGANLGGGRSTEAYPPLPGGDAQVLLGPGSQGLDDDGHTVKDGDTTSVAFDLGFWETEWRRARHDQPGRPVRLRGVVRRASGYLEIHTRWAAQQHAGWLGYLTDLREVHGRLERATGRARAAAKANASCFDCGGTLTRRVDPNTGLEETEKTGRLDPETGLPEERPVVTCGTCRRRYGAQEYLLALQEARGSGLQGWVTISDAAKVTRRSVDTLKSWTKTRSKDPVEEPLPGLVSTCCVVAWTAEGKPVQGRQLVWWPDVESRTDRAQRRQGRAS